MIISIDCSSVELYWAGLVAFYKGAISNPEKLQKKLVFTFVGTGEIGSDCGSLRKEFFEAGLSLANKKLFEGKSLKEQELILEEAVSRREANLRALSRGVAVRTLGILRLIQEYPHLMKALFMHLFESTPNTSSEILSYEMFLRFVMHIEENDLGASISPSALLCFITGLSCIPPKSSLISIRIKFHCGSCSSNLLTRVAACTNTVYLPVIHKSDDFFKHFITAPNFGLHMAQYNVTFIDYICI
uniref:HECT domain-containing protein n=1 Tax=Amphimedon queenslandica TaxID=400682 RepID=A0A1X7V1X8_AMPQE